LQEVTELNSDHFEKFYTDAELLDQTNKAAKKVSSCTVCFLNF